MAGNQFILAKFVRVNEKTLCRCSTTTCTLFSILYKIFSKIGLIKQCKLSSYDFATITNSQPQNFGHKLIKMFSQFRYKLWHGVIELIKSSSPFRCSHRTTIIELHSVWVIIMFFREINEIFRCQHQPTSTELIEFMNKCHRTFWKEDMLWIYSSVYTKLEWHFEHWW